MGVLWILGILYEVGRVCVKMLLFGRVYVVYGNVIGK